MCSVNLCIILLFKSWGGLQSDDQTIAWVEWRLEEKWGKNRQDSRLNFQKRLNQQGSPKGKRVEFFDFYFDVSNWLLCTSCWMNLTYPCDHLTIKTEVSPDVSLRQMPMLLSSVTISPSLTRIIADSFLVGLPDSSLISSDLPSNFLSPRFLKYTPILFSATSLLHFL